jgi:[protein-PII] uridylyltransferase
LHDKAMALLTGGLEFVRAEEKQRELLMEEVRTLLPDQMDEEELHAHFATLPPRYFQIHSAREVLDDLILAHRFMRLQISDQDNPLAPVVNWHNEPDRACNAVKICTWDRAGLFNKIAGSFSSAGLNILSARIFTRADGIALDTFFVTDARSGSLAGTEERDKFENVLHKALTGGEVEFQALIARQKIPALPYQAYAGERIATSIRFDNEGSETRTLIEIETEDRLGLLYAISHTFSELKLDISAAKVFTEKGAAIDSFYVRELDGGKIVAPERQKAIEKALRHSISLLEKQ